MVAAAASAAGDCGSGGRVAIRDGGVSEGEVLGLVQVRRGTGVVSLTSWRRAPSLDRPPHVLSVMMRSRRGAILSRRRNHNDAVRFLKPSSDAFGQRKKGEIYTKRYQNNMKGTFRAYT